jgi:hypothetical protein
MLTSDACAAREADRDRPRPDGRAVLRAPASHHGRQDAPAPRRVLDRARPARRQRRACRRDPARPRRLLDAARPSRARLLLRGRCAARHADGPLGSNSPPATSSTTDERGWKTSSAATARSATRARSPGRSGAAAPAAVRAHERPRRGDQAGDSRAGALRRGSPGKARLSGAADRRQRRARLARAGAAGRRRDSSPARPARGDLVPLARGPDREALPALRSTAAPARPTSRAARAARQPVLRATPRRSIRPSAAEVARNPRSQSARLRVAVKIV